MATTPHTHPRYGYAQHGQGWRTLLPDACPCCMANSTRATLACCHRDVTCATCGHGLPAYLAWLGKARVQAVLAGSTPAQLRAYPVAAMRRYVAA